ncbi:MAG: pyridoxamine 5'-phosphate oxidase [Phycisphaerales bacterium]
MPPAAPEPQSGSFDQAEAPPTRSEQLPEPLPPDPFPLFAAWYAEALARRAQPNPNSMALATVEPDGRPSARIVLCKSIDEREGSLTFFTNYDSAKGRALAANPVAAVLFHWDALDRQVRIEGPVARVSEAESDAYFATRPWESRIGAWSSEQSRPIGSRRELHARVAAAMQRFGISPLRLPAPGEPVAIPRPAHWGGYRILAQRVELWVSGRGRIHDRGLWERAPGPAPGPWSAVRLQP